MTAEDVAMCMMGKIDEQQKDKGNIYTEGSVVRRLSDLLVNAMLFLHLATLPRHRDRASANSSTNDENPLPNSDSNNSLRVHVMPLAGSTEMSLF